MRAHTGKLAVADNYYQICISHRRAALCDDQHGHTVGGFPERLAERGVGRQVERRKAVIQNQQVGAVHQCARDAEPLPLTAAEIPAALLHAAVQPLGELLDKFKRLRRLQRGKQLLVRRVGTMPICLRSCAKG